MELEHVIRFRPEPPGEQAEPRNVIAGAPELTIRNLYTDPSGAFSAGIWESTPGKWPVDYTEDEFCLLLAGTVELIDARGRSARFKAGAPLIVIYRQIGPGPKDKRVTAIAFPGSAKSPIYTNLTGERVVLRSVAGVGGRCEQTTGSVSESVIPDGGLAEVLEDCWCCAPAGETCTPGTRSGLGRAYLAQCFK